ncbi:ribonuclease H-like domain-containing protein [Tanacetum coccineum]
MSQPTNDEFSQHLSDDEASNHEDASDTGAAPKQQKQAIPQTTAISNIKLPILKKEEYDIWAMEMEHYLEYIDNEVLKVIQNGNSKKRISTGKDGEHMRIFHGMDDAKEIWEAIRTRFGGNANSKKMQKAVFKQQFEAFTISSSEGLEKGYDRFQQLLSQLEAHGAEVSTEDANHKFLRSLPPAWSNLAMTMRTKPDVDTLSIDDLYNNLRVFEQEIQGASKTSSSAQNVAFVSQSKSSTNKVKSGFTGAYSTCTPSTSSTNIPEKEALAGFADEVIYSLFAKQSEDWDLLHEDLEQIDDLDIEEMDINWQIAMIAIRMKKFYKKTGRRVRVDGKTPVGFDKKKLECFNCHNTGHFARECTAKGTHDGKKKRDSFYQHQEAGKQEKNQMGLLTMDDGIVNWGEHTEDEETNHALMAISSSSEVSLCSKTCIDSYNTLKTLCDEQMNQLGDQEAQILAYSQAVKKLEAQLVTFQKQQLSLNEKLTFQANEIYEKDEKLKKYRRIGMKAVKEKEQLQKTLDSWKDSSKNLWRLINSGMRSNSKVSLGYEIQSNNEVLSYEEEIKFSVFNCSEEDSGPQEPEPSVSDDRSSEYSTCQSNNSAKSIGTSSEHSVDPESEILRVPQEVYVSTPITTNEKGVIAPKSKEVEPSCVSHIKTPRQPIKDQETPKVNKKNWNVMIERELGEGYSFTKKKCFVCGSLSHLIKDCDYYEKKMAREAEVKKQRVFNTGNNMEKSVWTNTDRINHANQFVPRPVQLNTGRPNINSVRTNINTGRTNINSVRPRVNTVNSNINTVRSKQPIPTRTSNSFSPKRLQVNQLNQRMHFSKSHSSVRRPFEKNTAQMSHSHAVKGNWGSAVKTSAGYNWRNTIPNSNCNGGPISIRTDHPLKNMVDRGIFDSGCSGHMTGNKDQLEDFEEFNGGSVTFGGSKGYITGKGKIRVGNLDFDSVSFVKELGHFNLFSISQICDKQHKVLFTETECLVVSSDFKMPDENQILLKVPRHHNMYSFDMKTPTANRPPPVHAGRRNSFSVTSGWWQSTARPMTHFPTPERLDGLSNLLKVAKVTIGGGKRANNEKGTNQDPSTQDVSSNPASFQDDDSNSDSDEQVILVPSYPSNNITGAEPKDTFDAHSNGVLVDTAEDIFQQELTRLKRASAKTVPPGSIPVPTGSIPVPSGDTMVSPSEVSVPTGGVPVPSGSNKEAITQTFCIVCFACFLSVEPRVLAQDLETKVDTQNKRDARGIVSETRLRLVAQGHRWSVGFDYDEEDVKSATSHSTKSLVWKPLSTFVLNMFTEVGTIDKTLLFKMQKEISSLDLKKFDLENVRTATTPYEAPKPKSKNEPDNPDKSVTPTIPNLEAVKRIFNLCIIKAKPTLGLWSLELGPPTILATIDETPYTITEDSVRSQLQLADDGGIDDLPIAEIYSGMDNLGYVTEGEGAGVAAQAVPPPIPETIPETRPDPNQPQDHLSTPPRQQTSDPIAPVFEHGQSSDPNIASFSRAYETDDEPFTSTNVEDEPLGGSFHASPPRSTQAPPAGHTSGGAEDLITLTALSSVVSTFV